MKDTNYIHEQVGPYQLYLFERIPKDTLDFSDSIKCEKRSSKEETIKIIREYGHIKEYYFDDPLGKIILEVDNIPKFENILHDIFLRTGWNPQLRSPSISGMVSKARRIIYSNENRYQFLKDLGRKITKNCETEFCRLEFLGSSKEVGRAGILVHTNNSSVCLDFGINVATKERPYVIPDLKHNFYGVVLSHAHLDHSGSIPFLFQEGMDFPIYGTEPTLFLMYLLCKDFEKIAKLNATPSYSKHDIKKMLTRYIALNYRKRVKIAPDIEMELVNSGHIPGSSAVLLYIKNHVLLYTGDFNTRKTRILNPMEADLPKIDYLITECTYFDRALPSQKEAEKEIVQLCNDTVSNDGIALIPTFAVGRSQEVLTFLHDYEIKGSLYVDGMIREATKIIQSSPEFLRREIRTQSLTWVWGELERQEAMNNTNVILTTSGMLTGGPIYTYLKKCHDDPQNALILVGYQVEGTPGRAIIEGARKIVIDGEEIELKLQLYQVRLSGHADRGGIWNFIKSLTSLKGVFAVHGSEENCVNLAKRVKEKLDIEAHAPSNLDAYRLF